MKTMVTLGAPSDYGMHDDEHRFRIDDYFPSKTPRARREGEIYEDVQERLQRLHNGR